MQLYSNRNFRNEFARVRGSMIDSRPDEPIDPDENAQPVGHFSTEIEEQPRAGSYDNCVQ